MNPATSRIYWMYQKNRHLIDALVLRRAPKFVYQFQPSPVGGEIPVFTFHLALPELFEAQCKHLVENGYKTLSAAEFNDSIMTGSAVPRNSVFLTFDDGLKHVWTVAYPILRKYGLKATCYLIPGLIPPDAGGPRPTLVDVWDGCADVSDIVGIRKSDHALATWQEIQVMHESGVIDFESHTMNHALVPISDEITGFVHPGYDAYFYGNVFSPLYRTDGRDDVSRTLPLGTPIYASRPRMQAKSRYFDDENLRQFCIDFVEKAGGREYFHSKDWESKLRRAVQTYKETHELEDRYEDAHERDQSVFEELLESKQIIEGHLPGKDVTQLCYPWYDAEDFAIEASRKAGYRVNLFGQREGRYTNQPGSDPFEIVRVEEIFLQRLPGHDRKSIPQLLTELYSQRSLPKILFPEGPLGIV